jgi:hypothetical protein
MSSSPSLFRSKPILYALALAAICLAGIIILRVPTVSVDHQKTLETWRNATRLLQAIESFNSDHNRLPDAAKVAELLTEGEDGRNLLRILLAKDQDGKDLPSNKWIRYLSVAETNDKKKGGLLYPSGTSESLPEGLYDAWGRPFHVKFDTDNDQEIQDPLTQDNVVSYKIAIVYSYGKDGKPGGGDDIKTW